MPAVCLDQPETGQLPWLATIAAVACAWRCLAANAKYSTAEDLGGFYRTIAGRRQSGNRFSRPNGEGEISELRACTMG
jgi:hypothetical protein